MLHAILKILMYGFIAFCILIPLVWLYEIYTKGFAWDNTLVYAKSFLIFLVLSLFSYWVIVTRFD